MNQGLIFEFEVCPDERNTSIYVVNWRVIQTLFSFENKVFFLLSKQVFNYQNVVIIFLMILLQKIFV